MLKAVIWDLDGTLLYTLPDLQGACNHAISLFGFNGRTIEEVRNFIGNGMAKLVSRACNETQSEETLKVMCDDFRNYYLKHCTDGTTMYPGIDTLILQLKQKGLMNIVFTNKFQSATDIVIPHYFGNVFDYVLGENTSLPRKPAPDGIYHILDKFGLGKDEVVYIGDSEVDIRTCGNAGISCIGVGYGYRGSEVLKEIGATCTVDTVNELESELLSRLI